MEEIFSKEWKVFGRGRKIFSMEWKKIISMEHGKVVFIRFHTTHCKRVSCLMSSRRGGRAPTMCLISCSRPSLTDFYFHVRIRNSNLRLESLLQIGSGNLTSSHDDIPRRPLPVTNVQVALLREARRLTRKFRDVTTRDVQWPNCKSLPFPQLGDVVFNFLFLKIISKKIFLDLAKRVYVIIIIKYMEPNWVVAISASS